MSLHVPRPRRLTLAALLLLAVLAIAAAPAAARGGDHRAYGATTLKLDPAAVNALTGLGVTPAPIAPARAVSADELVFLITNSLRNALRTGLIRLGVLWQRAHGVAARELRIDLICVLRPRKGPSAIDHVRGVV